MTEPHEIELKLEFNPADRERLDATAPFAETQTKVEHLVATYFDTPDCDVRKAGFSLRIRCEGGKRVQTVKADDSAVGLFARGEWEREVSGDRPLLDARNGPLAQIIGHDAVTRLDPLFVTDMQRTTRVLDMEDARFICAIDQGEIRAGARCLALCEVELELESGSARPLFDFARRLDEAVPFHLSALSKAGRGDREGHAGKRGIERGRDTRRAPGDDHRRPERHPEYPVVPGEDGSGNLHCRSFATDRRTAEKCEQGEDAFDEADPERHERAYCPPRVLGRGDNLRNA